MKQALLIVSTIIFTMACSSSRRAAAELNVNWELVMFPASTKSLAEIFTMNRPSLQFESGHISGSTGCNRISGTYSVSGSSIEFGPNLATTKMGCPNYDETLFLDAFNKVNHYRVQNSELQLLQDSTLLMSFAKR